MQEQPFAGLRVLELGTGIAVPYAGKLLVDAGADVIKAEAPAGDPLRRYTASGRALEAGEDGALFRFLNAGKRGVQLDLAADADRRALRALAARADLLIESTGPGVLKGAGLGLETLQAENPGLSLVSLSPWGQEGPWAARPATGFTLEAACGGTAYRGLPEREPLAAGGRVLEWATGAYAAVAALLAHAAARRGGRGLHADLSSFEVAVAALTIYHDLQGQWFDVPLERSIDTPSIEPSRDGWVGFCVTTGQQWKDFCAMLGRPEVAEDERYYEARVRMHHLAFIQELVHGWSRVRTTEEAIAEAELRRLPAAPIGNGRTVLGFDHFQQRGVFVKNPAGFLQPRRPWQLSDCETPAPGKAPRLGELQAATELAPSAWPPREGAAGQGAARESEASEAAQALHGLRVIDLTAFWAGPAATAVLAEFGADVIKIESTKRPDGMRFAGAVREDPLWERSPIFHGANRGKRGITLDLDAEAGKKLFRKLVEGADLLIENFSARVMANFGFDWETLHAWNPRLVMARMPAWGLSGPWHSRVGFAANVEQASGLAWLTGYPDLPLIVRGVCDPVGGMHTLVGILAALEARRKTGKGQLVECALVEPALNLAAEQVIEWSAYGKLLERRGNRGPAAAPQGCYRCRGDAATDRLHSPNEPWLALSVESDAQWQGLCRALSHPAWSAAAQFENARGRHAAHDVLDMHLARWAATRTAEDAAALLRAEGVPAEALVNAHFLVPNPQLEHRAFFRTLEHPVSGPTRYPAAFPARMSQAAAAHTAQAAAPRGADRAAPTLGRHTEQVLAEELGLGREELAALAEAGVIGTRPAWEG